MLKSSNRRKRRQQKSRSRPARLAVNMKGSKLRNPLLGIDPMRSCKIKAVLLMLALLAPLFCEAQSNVYSIGIYSAGTSYADICSLTLPFPPYRYKLTERSWLEDTNGFTIIDIYHKSAPDDVYRRSLEVECGSERFIVPLDSLPSRRDKSVDRSLVKKGSGDLVHLVTQRATNRGARAITNTLVVVQANWMILSRKFQDIVVVDGDH